MNCNYISERVADLFDDLATGEDKAEILDHIGQCGECREAYKEYLAIPAALNAAQGSPAGREETRAILSLVGEESPSAPPHPFLQPGWRGIRRVAASILVFLVIASGIAYVAVVRNAAMAAGNILEKSISAMISLKTAYMVFSVRTSPGENFESIDPASGFVDFKVWKTFGPKPRWRFEKPGRNIIMDGKSQYMTNQTGGYTLQGTPKAGFTGWMRVFLEPLEILETELAYARKHPSSCSVKEIGDQMEVTVKVKASGNFTNPWALNTSIPEANTRRVYRFSRQTRELTAMELFVETRQEEICVLKLSEIRVNPPLPDSLFIFRNSTRRPLVTLDEWDRASAFGFKEISGEEAARLFFTSCEKSDWKVVMRFSPLWAIAGGNTFRAVQNRFGGSQLLHVGTAFTSGIYAGIYIPYTVRLKSGDTLEGNMAIRNDNSFHTWQIDGGY
ncbi:MAG: hypothetical protein WCK34_16435 [Bacteroidota bacterium]